MTRRLLPCLFPVLTPHFSGLAGVCSMVALSIRGHTAVNDRDSVREASGGVRVGKRLGCLLSRVGLALVLVEMEGGRWRREGCLQMGGRPVSPGPGDDFLDMFRIGWGQHRGKSGVCLWPSACDGGELLLGFLWFA